MVDYFLITGNKFFYFPSSGRPKILYLHRTLVRYHCGTRFKLPGVLP